MKQRQQGDMDDLRGPGSQDMHPQNLTGIAMHYHLDQAFALAGYLTAGQFLIGASADDDLVAPGPGLLFGDPHIGNLRDGVDADGEEMGKPVAQGEAEVKKCVWLTDYIVENAGAFLAPEQVKTDAKKSYIRFDPLGVVFLIMPWNFPAWQVFRAAVPAIAAGNGVLLKHASMVSGTSLKLEEIFGIDLFKSICSNRL